MGWESPRKLLRGGKATPSPTLHAQQFGSWELVVGDWLFHIDTRRADADVVAV
jgi:hypothetical protein